MKRFEENKQTKQSWTLKADDKLSKFLPKKGMTKLTTLNYLIANAVRTLYLLTSTWC